MKPQRLKAKILKNVATSRAKASRSRHCEIRKLDQSQGKSIKMATNGIRTHARIIFNLRRTLELLFLVRYVVRIPFVAIFDDTPGGRSTYYF